MWKYCVEILSPKMFCSDPRLVCVGSPVLVGKLDGGGGEVGWREGGGGATCSRSVL